MVFIFEVKTNTIKICIVSQIDNIYIVVFELGGKRCGVFNVFFCKPSFWMIVCFDLVEVNYLAVRISFITKIYVLEIS